MMESEAIVIGCDERHAIETCGGKAFALWRLREEGLPVPKWLVVTPAAFDAGELKSEASALIKAKLGELGMEGRLLAARSSSVEEDAAESSFAGQFESFLGVSVDDLEEKILKVWESGYADRVGAYKDARGEERAVRLPAVLVQEMVASEVSGVAFSVDPVSGNWERCLVSALRGLGSTLVDGESDADGFVVDREGRVLERQIAQKTKARFMKTDGGAGFSEEELSSAEGSAACLTDAQVGRVAALARRCERFFGRPQDIEWAISGGVLYLLQSRPITTLHQVAGQQGKLFIWDNSNIAESYGGLTLPLTFSFARYIYTEVYRQFCLLLKVPSKRVSRHREVFGQMLGLIRGRVYYNLLSWYKVLALLPGYNLNQRFMEQMMGVKEPLSADAQKEVDKVRGGGKLGDAYGLARSLAGLLWKHWRMERDVRRFYRRLDDSLGSAARPLEEMRLDELADHFHDLERDLLLAWDAPLVNDFIAMVFFGALKGFCQKWVGDEEDSLHNDLLCKMGSIVSAEPAKRIREMATTAAKSPELVGVLREKSVGQIRKALERHEDLRSEVEAYLHKFGDRCLDELKLESATLVDDPMPLYRSIGELAFRMNEELASGDVAADFVDDRQEKAEERAFAKLKGSPLRKLVFKYALKHARLRVSGRENLRFERTRLFGRIRRLFLEIGKRLNAFNVLEEARDIFYLEIYEIIGYIEGSGSCNDLRGLVALRKAEYTGYRQGEVPDDRFETRGAVPIGNRFKSAAPDVEENGDADRELRGIGCCPGRVRGIARVVLDPQGAHLRRGEILVARQTDPGWIMLFPLAAGLLVERGSLLSHSAIVSRELGLPAVVSLKRLLDTIQTGDEIELDGSKGTVRIIRKGEDVG